MEATRPALDLAIVLVRPQRPANVAAACRAMKNMGLRDLRFVAPPAGLERPEARALAHGAEELLDRATRHASLLDAVADARFVAGTSGRPSDRAWTPRELSRGALLRSRGGRIAVVFGPESSGLTSDELRLCHVTVRIPTDPAHASLNLAQAVLVVAYEMFVGAQAPTASPLSPPPASASALEAALGQLREALLRIGYLAAANPEPILGELRALLARAGPSEREVTLLRGLARQIAWAGRRVAASRRPGG